MIELADKCDGVQAKLDSLIDNKGRMSVEGQALGIAMLMTINATLLKDCAAALRAQSTVGEDK
jgi:hypothetical protein